MLVGHRRNLGYLNRVLAKGEPAHAYLLHGPEGVGKRAVALEFAKSLLCNEGAKKIGGCGECESCCAVAALTHPDLIFLSADGLLVEGDNKREIGIKNIRELKRRVSQTSWGNGARAVIIDGAENLSRDAQSALLKTLEEPGRGVVFLLITSSPGALFETIRSRSVALGFTYVSGEDMAPLLGDAAETRHSAIFKLAQGRPGVLTRLLADNDFFELAKTDDAAFGKLIAADLTDKFSFSEKEARVDGRLEALLLFLMSRLRDKLGSITNSAPSKEAQAGNAALKAIAAFNRRLLNDFFILETTAVNRRLLADGLLFNLHLLSTQKII